MILDVLVEAYGLSSDHIACPSPETQAQILESANPVHLHRAVELASNGGIDLARYISHRFSLDQAPEAFEAAERKVGMRVVITR